MGMVEAKGKEGVRKRQFGVENLLAACPAGPNLIIYSSVQLYMCTSIIRPEPEFLKQIL